MKKIVIIIVIILILLLAIYLFLPAILHLLGLYPDCQGEKRYHFSNGKVLIITTSHDSLGEGKNSKPTGVYASELFIPYFEFVDSNLSVDIASINGGKIPIDPMSLHWPLITSSDKRFLNDGDLLKKAQNSLSIQDVSFLNYDMIYIAGGWGAAYDLGFSQKLGDGISVAYAHNAIIGTVCHGSLGLLQAKDLSGKPLIEGKKITGVTNKQIKELHIEMTPMHPETELKNTGANYMSATSTFDIFANLVVEDGKIITGQNQNATQEVAQRMMNQLCSKQEDEMS